MRKSQGVTLVELLIAMSIMATLSALAIPSMGQLTRSAQRAAALNGFLHAIYFARSEAIKRHTVVVLCKTIDGEHCDNGGANWSAGWMVFVNTDHDDLPVRDPGELILQKYASWPAGTITSNRAAFSFRAYNQSTANGTIVFCPSRDSHDARAIIISHIGRPRLSTRDADNKPLRCPA